MPWYFFSKHGSPDLPDAGTSSLQTGQVYPFIGALAGISGSVAQAKTAPVGFLFCNGASMDQLEFPDLYNYFTLNGVSFGAAPVGFFKIPDTQDRAPLGSDTNPVGTAAGSSTHTHTGTGTHTHGLSSHVHTAADHTHNLSPHTHTHTSHTHGTAATVTPMNSLETTVDTFITATNPGIAPGNVRIRVAPEVHSHDIVGQTDATAITTGNPNTTATLASSNPTSGSISGGALNSGGPSASISGNESAAASFPSIGNDNIPPYTNINFMVKT